MDESGTPGCVGKVLGCGFGSDSGGWDVGEMRFRCCGWGGLLFPGGDLWQRVGRRGGMQQIAARPVANQRRWKGNQACRFAGSANGGFPICKFMARRL